ncbi:carbohydrate ABC transporter permease [Streptomyces radiopugnans]|uniref:Multiple sugar transport system permease protein n=1 Tax=Streptomyces radiopugnans TaxID=403935 RepID=A0A1H9JV12_9ACTN|nr:carbohydrate ABC transporter permease [Streptomyces radiopugnans]SEQ90603.1 multiple sugar transport system permease protein [Streptomyces radiopugnans]
MSFLTRTEGAHAAAPGRRPAAGRLSVAAAVAFMTLAACYMLLPVYWLLVSATKSQSDLVSTPGLLPAEWHLGDNLTALFEQQDGVFGRWLLNSLLYAGVGAAIATFLAAAAGYALAKYTFTGREALFSVILGGVLVPATALALPLFLLFAEVDATNTFWSVFLPSVVSPFGVYLSRIFAAASVPDEVVEAARMDGAGELRIFCGIALRMMSPALVTVFLFQFVVIWNNFLLPLVMLQDDTLYPVTLGLFTWQSQTSRLPELQTLTIVGALVSVVPIVLTFLMLQRYWRAGLTAGAVKS